MTANYSDDRCDGKKLINFCKFYYSNDNLTTVAKITKNQSQLWYELRYVRIIASTVYEAADCKTANGSFYEKIMDVRTLDTPAMIKERRIKSAVIEAVEKIIGEKNFFKLLLSSYYGGYYSEYPCFGTSPDGVTTTSVIEIKCPTTLETTLNYCRNYQINPKYRA